MLLLREAGPPRRRLVQIRLNDADELLFHEEPIFADGRPVGVTTSGAFGHRVGASLGMGYVTMDEPITTALLQSTRFEIGIGDRRVAARAQLGAWYDPKNERIRS